MIVAEVQTHKRIERNEEPTNISPKICPTDFLTKMQEQVNAEQPFLSVILKQIHILSQKNETGFKTHTLYKAISK